MRWRLLVLGIACFSSGCDKAQVAIEKDEKLRSNSSENVLSLEIVGWSFVGPNEIGSGWTTVRIRQWFQLHLG